VAVTLLVIGLLMNISGVALGSSRDLTWFARRIRSQLVSAANAVGSRLRQLWFRLSGQKQHRKIICGTGNITLTSSVSATASVWRGVPDGVEPAEAIRRLRDRTDTLHDMLASESARRSDEVQRLTRESEELKHQLDSDLATLHSRIDDFDVKPAGMRATGAVLVICGSALMFVAGLMSS